MAPSVSSAPLKVGDCYISNSDLILDCDSNVGWIVEKTCPSYDGLLFGERVYRPVDPREEITNDQSLSRVRKMRDELKGAIDELSKIERSDCDELMALKALKSVFFTDFWDKRIKELEDDSGSGNSGKLPAEPKQPVDKRGGTGQYA